MNYAKRQLEPCPDTSVQNEKSENLQDKVLYNITNSRWFHFIIYYLGTHFK